MFSIYENKRYVPVYLYDQHAFYLPYHQKMKTEVMLFVQEQRCIGKVHGALAFPLTLPS